VTVAARQGVSVKMREAMRSTIERAIMRTNSGAKPLRKYCIVPKPRTIANTLIVFATVERSAVEIALVGRGVLGEPDGVDVVLSIRVILALWSETKKLSISPPSVPLNTTANSFPATTVTLCGVATYKYSVEASRSLRAKYEDKDPPQAASVPCPRKTRIATMQVTLRAIADINVALL
jgi:biotin carboxylase